MKRTGTLKIALFFLFAVAALFLSASRSGAQAGSIKTSAAFPFNITVPNTCTGESIAFTGRVRADLLIVTDGNGGTHIEGNANTQGVTGTGLTSNRVYRSSGTTHLSSNTRQGGIAGTYILTSRFRVISQGPASNLVGTATFEATVNNRNQVTITLQSLDIDCRG